jgi:hypothetical protein
MKGEAEYLKLLAKYRPSQPKYDPAIKVNEETYYKMFPQYKVNLPS